MKKIKILTITLAIVLITLVAFFGVYVKTQNRMENKVKGYEYAMDLKGKRILRLTVDNSEETSEKNDKENTENKTEEKKEENAENQTQENKEEVNYANVKSIIEKRLNKFGTENYLIRLDEATGEVVIELEESERTDDIVSNLVTTGKFEIIDTDTKEVLMNNEDIKLSNVLYGSNSSSGTSSGTQVYLNIEFTKDGAKKLEDISNNYVKNKETEESTEEENTEEGNTEETNSEEENENSEEDKKEKTITMKIDDEDVMSTAFEEPIKIGKLQLSVGSPTTDNKTLQENMEKASNMATILDTGKMPAKYKVEENDFVSSNVENNQLKIITYIIIAVVIIGLFVLVIKFKATGLIGAISYIGLVSILLLTIRYTNVVLSVEGLFGITVSLLLNYIFTYKLLSKISKEKETEENIKKSVIETYKDFFIKIIPICIVTVIFVFTNYTPISSFGMIMFWGITITALYNFIVTINFIKIKASK